MRGVVAALVLLVLALAALGVGFAWFAMRAARALPLPPVADGIVVLTGGAGRVERALHLLAEGRGRQLLVSGTGRAEFADLASRAGVETRLADRVTLGRGARSTRGNAHETAQWVRARGIGSLVVVTSGYHMARAMIELHRTLPADVTVYPSPLVPSAVDGADRVPLRLLLVEYAKWLGAAVGLSALVAREEEAAWMQEGAMQEGGAEMRMGGG